MTNRFKSESDESAWAGARFLFLFVVAGLIASFAGWFVPGHLAIRILRVVGTLLATAAVAGLCVVCVHASLFPKTLQVKKKYIRLLRGKTILVEVPLDNVASIEVLTRKMLGETAQSAYLQGRVVGSVLGGALGAAAGGQMAHKQFNPNEPLGIVIRLIDPEVSTTCLSRFYLKRSNDAIEIRLNWEWRHEDVAARLNVQCSRSRAKMNAKENNDA